MNETARASDAQAVSAWLETLLSPTGELPFAEVHLDQLFADYEPRKAVNRTADLVMLARLSQALSRARAVPSAV